jgi:hypothetical protein
MEVKADTGANNKFSFLGASGDTLKVDAVANFGTSVGTSSYTGPLLKGFSNTVDKVDLKVFAGGTIDSYTVTSGIGLLQMHDAALDKATLAFNNADISSIGTFRIGTDGGTGSLITHS